MEVTEVKVKLVQANRDRLKAYCTMTLDGEFVVRDLKLIEGASGLFVAMPSRKLADRCPKCGGKNHLRARFCNDCGHHLDENRAGTDREGRPKLHADIAHPINSQCRERIQQTIERAYHEEVERSKQPGYRPVDLDEPEDFDYHGDPSHDAPRTHAGGGAPQRPTDQPGQGGEAKQQETDGDEQNEEHTFGEGIL
jgi:stage V sporulation protein G